MDKKKSDDFGFDFDQPKKQEKSDAFNFDDFGKAVPEKKKDDFDPFADHGGDKSASTGLEGIFDNPPPQNAEPKRPSADDIFGSNILVPENSKPEAKASTNPFDAFAGANSSSPPQQNNPFVSDVFSQNNAFGGNMYQQNTGGFGVSGGMGGNSSGFGGQGDWGAGFQSNFGTGNLAAGSAFSGAGAFDNNKPAPQKSEFSSLDVFGKKQAEVPKQPNSSKPTGANLPQGVSGFDLFE